MRENNLQEGKRILLPFPEGLRHGTSTQHIWVEHQGSGYVWKRKTREGLRSRDNPQRYLSDLRLHFLKFLPPSRIVLTHSTQEPKAVVLNQWVETPWGVAGKGVK